MSDTSSTHAGSPSRPCQFEDRFRLYLDESGDHVFREVAATAHRFLCFLGCWFQNPAYLRFHAALEALKGQHLPHHPDDPVVLHREDMINARKAFTRLRDPQRRAEFDNELLRIIAEADYLNHINRCGDIMAESRGGREDRLLKESYTHVCEHGAWMTPTHAFRSALTSSQLKLKQKHANISGLQLADLLGHPVKNWVLRQHDLLVEDVPPFAQRLLTVIESKMNRHLYHGKIEGYGAVIYPKR